jgi:hypothetical protein
MQARVDGIADANTDTANGSPVPSTIESPTDTNPSGTQVPGAGAADGAPTMSIAYSLDGISWSIETIDELLGDTATDDERPAVVRISSTGNQLVVAVTLDATSDHEPGGRQIALIGTPTG